MSNINGMCLACKPKTLSSCCREPPCLDWEDGVLYAISAGTLLIFMPASDVASVAPFLSSRLGRQRDSGATGFGNAREVRNLLEAAISRQSARILGQRCQGESKGKSCATVDPVDRPHEGHVGHKQAACCQA